MGELLRLNKIVWYLKKGDHRIPLHVHARVGSKECKIMLPHLEVDKNKGFSKSELSAVLKLTKKNLLKIITRIEEE